MSTWSKIKISIFSWILFGLFCSSLAAESAEDSAEDSIAWEPETTVKTKKVSVGATYYFDSRDYKTLNLLTSVPDLPGKFRLWGFVDLHGQKTPLLLSVHSTCRTWSKVKSSSLLRIHSKQSKTAFGSLPWRIMVSASSLSISSIYLSYSNPCQLSRTGQHDR